MSGWTYAKSGVDIDQKSNAIKALVNKINYRRVGIGRSIQISGQFTSLIDFGDVYMTMATDGVGSKLIIAEALDKWDTIGIDCIAMNVNDTICVNAEPTSFVDYIAINKPKNDITSRIGIGLQRGAELSNIEVVGGEIAVLPDIINGLDLSGTCLGYVKKDNVITGKECKKGDLIMSIRSSGVHSNGLTLVRKVLQSNNISLNDKISGLHRSIGEELLTPTEIYVKQILEITSNYMVHGLIDITGGGLRNILRMRRNLRYTISDPIKPTPIFKIIQDIGKIEDKEIYQTLNMGMGFMVIAPPNDAEDIQSKYSNIDIIGYVDNGTGVLLETQNIMYDHY